ncbi:MAG: autotransporter outer membrane beta-barrel domain-containing protein [Granulosicoccus sp.]
MRKKGLVVLGLSGAIVVSGVGITRAEFIPTLPLGQIGRTDLQQRTGDAVQMVCGQFIGAGGVDPNAANATFQADLFDKCGEMVNTANALNGAENGTAKNLGISAGQLQGALQNVAGEEAAAAGSLSTEISDGQAKNVTKRIANLLSRSSGLQVSSANVFGSNGVFAYNPSMESGGTASADSVDSGGFSTFVNGMVGEADRSASAGEDGFEATSSGITAGLDYSFSAKGVLGVAFGLTSHSADFTENESVAGGGLDMDLVGLSLYGLWFGNDWYADGVLSFGNGTIDLERRIFIPAAEGLLDADGGANDGADRTATAETDSSQIGVSFGAGMDIVNGPFTFAPYARMSFLSVTIDSYDEAGAQGLNLSVQEQDIDSLTMAFGFRLVAIKSTSFGVLAPQLSVELEHEFADDERELISTYVHDPRQNQLIATTDAPDRDYLVAGMGISSVTRNGVQLFADVKSTIGLEAINDVVYTVGGRFEF